MTAFAQPSGQDEMAGVFALEIKKMIAREAANAPRSAQKAIGPSEIGVDCDRRLGYKLLDWPTVNTGGDKATQIGRAVHGLLEQAYIYGDADPGRYLVEHRVTVRGGITGSADLYDRKWGTVLDWKVVGDSMLAKYRRHGPSNQYRIQAHLYGLGFKNMNEKPERVAIVFLPRAATLESMHVWTEEWDERVALDALERLDMVLDLIGLLRVEQRPERWAQVPAQPGDGCMFCPWFQPYSTDPAVGCPGTKEAA